MVTGLILVMVNSTIGQDEASKDEKKAPFVPGVVVAEKSEIENLTPESFRRAARNGDLEKVKSGLKAGIEVDSKSAYGATALFFACDRGHEEVVDLLLENGADPNVQDTFYGSTPLKWSMSKGNHAILISLLRKDAAEIETVLLNAVNRSNAKLAAKVLDLKKADDATLVKARDAAFRIKEEEKMNEMLALFEPFGLPDRVQIKLTPELLSSIVGKYANEQMSAEVKIEDEAPMIQFNSGNTTELIASTENLFSIGNGEVEFVIEESAPASAIVCNFGRRKFTLDRVEGGTSVEGQPLKSKTESAKDAESAKGVESGKNVESAEAVGSAESEPVFTASRTASLAADAEISSSNWPGFRGTGARGIAEGQKPPIKFYVSKVTHKR